jgi:predicted acyl esterase
MTNADGKATGGLAPFAERFCREGFAAVVFDCRQWDASDGQPREELSFLRQREDYGTVIGWATAPLTLPPAPAR